jgi:hypothetical protein
MFIIVHRCLHQLRVEAVGAAVQLHPLHHSTSLLDGDVGAGAGITVKEARGMVKWVQLYRNKIKM